MNPYYEDDHVTLYHGDALDVLHGLERSIDAVVTDPPYASGARTEAQKSIAVASNLDAQVKRLSRQMAEREAEILSLNDRLGILLSSRGELLGRLDELERWHRSTQTHEGRVE